MLVWLRAVRAWWEWLTPNWLSTIDLPDDALVVRGGTLRLTDLEKSVKKSLLEFQRPGLSVFAAEVLTQADLLEAAGERLPHTQVRFTTAGRLRAAGFNDFEQTLEPPHYSVWLPEHGWEERLGAFQDAFSAPVPRASLRRVVK